MNENDHYMHCTWMGIVFARAWLAAILRLLFLLRFIPEADPVIEMMMISIHDDRQVVAQWIHFHTMSIVRNHSLDGITKRANLQGARRGRATRKTRLAAVSRRDHQFCIQFATEWKILFNQLIHRHSSFSFKIHSKRFERKIGFARKAERHDFRPLSSH